MGIIWWHISFVFLFLFHKNFRFCYFLILALKQLSWKYIGYASNEQVYVMMASRIYFVCIESLMKKCFSKFPTSLGRWDGGGGGRGSASTPPPLFQTNNLGNIWPVFGQIFRERFGQGFFFFFCLLYCYTVEPRYNEVLGTMKITLLYQVSHYIRVKKLRNIKSWDQQSYLVISNRVLLYPTSL